MPTANTVPFSCESVGVDFADSVAVRHGGVPAGPVTGETVSHLPDVVLHQ